MSAALAVTIPTAETTLLLEPKSRHTTLTEEAMMMARKMQRHMRSGRTSYTLRINNLIAFFRRRKQDLAYVDCHPSRVRKKRKPPPDVHFAIWEENTPWWERQRKLFSRKEGGRSIPDNQILESLLIEGVPLWAQSGQRS